jgi:hypothetical protein
VLEESGIAAEPRALPNCSMGLLRATDGTRAVTLSLAPLKLVDQAVNLLGHFGIVCTKPLSQRLSKKIDGARVHT